jgi:hypothetical protein
MSDSLVAELARTLQYSEPTASRILSSSRVPSGLDPDYQLFLSLTNGGYTSDLFFHFFGLTEGAYDLVEWNQQAAWKKNYGLTDEHFVFAEDLLGQQYYFTMGRRKVIKCLWIESGDSTLVAEKFAYFVEDVILNLDSMAEARKLARSFLHKTKEQFKLHEHISYKIPLCLGGGELDLGNLEWMESLSHLQFLGQVVTQVKKLPAGTRISDVVIDPLSGMVELVAE